MYAGLHLKKLHKDKKHNTQTTAVQIIES